MTSRRADQCPYHRPFPRGFRDCGAFRPVPMHTVDSRHRPLADELTCTHLEVGVGAAAGRFYPRCAVGSAEERERWAEANADSTPGAEVTGTLAERRPARRPAG